MAHPQDTDHEDSRLVTQTRAQRAATWERFRRKLVASGLDAEVARFDEAVARDRRAKRRALRARALKFAPGAHRKPGLARATRSGRKATAHRCASHARSAAAGGSESGDSPPGDAGPRVEPPITAPLAVAR